MSYRIAVDTGGTFTDVVVADPRHNLTVNKALTDHSRVFNGIKEALAVTAAGLGVSLDDLLSETSIFIYATTRATNAIIEGKTARTAFLTTRGFKDTLVLREGGRPNAYDFSTPYPAPYVPRRLSFELDERIDAEGNVVTPLDEDQVRQVLRTLKSRDIEAIGVSLLWSIANSDHERRVGELIAEELPGIPFTLSHGVNPVIREYRRASSAVIDASLKPLMQTHLSNLEVDLKAAGFKGELLAATSFGGVMSAEALGERPIYSTRSGPSMAPIAGKVYGQAELGARDVIICDTGGTSFDVSMIRNGDVVFTRETWLGGRFLGHLTGLSSVDARSIGAGGGSIAWVDPGGLLRVGPQSAGSQPGPAAYGNGGEMPTVTDAATVLGYLNPTNFLGGRLTLDVEASRRAIDTVAGPLGISVEDAAIGIMKIASEAMVQAVQEITVNEGVDPRECLMVAGGGAAGLNIAAVVREIGAKHVLIPRTAGGLSACGAQFSDIISEYSATLLLDTRSFDLARANQVLAGLDLQMDGVAKDLEARGAISIERRYFVEARYEGQAWELEVPLRGNRFEGQAAIDQLIEDFHAVHDRVFAVTDPGSAVEVLFWKARLTAVVEKPSLVAGSEGGSDSARSHRTAHFGETGSVEIGAYDGPTLRVGSRIAGPAVIEEPTTTIVVYPGMTATVTPHRNYLIETGV
ncbi:hydantoinase A/oxoprolinase protein (plasmid) [Rhizobium etli]|uniref:Hydantoinase A/oxoprolinase protein n=1 Tax=Rhizobium etli TaxID=29449 RepID=A0AAN1ENK6_RHIET|nr:hydantoinase/oxoprolinase family protein [Rhizobium etli]AGS26563.1 hydantoinase A/oxoprolinase protein [Rhizobium etli bv. mimosae str. Mim1]ARQ13813.1 hydantoinase A/oxoprolinase protein [Rhizobium etli]